MVIDESEELDRPAKRPRLVNNSDSVEPASVTAPEVPPVPDAPSETSAEPEPLLGIDSTLRQLQLEPGTPLLPDPRARFRASWKLQMERIQASQAAMVDNIKPVAPSIDSLPIPPVPVQVNPMVHAIPSSAPPVKKSGISLLAQKLSAPIRSISSSPLTEQSETGDDESDQLSPTDPPPSRSPQRLVNGRNSGAGASARRVSKVRIESTPPSDTEVPAELPSSSPEPNGAVVSQQPTQPAPAVKMLDLSQASEQKGPPRFRKWAIKPSEPRAPSVDVRMETPAPQPSSSSQPTPVPPSPITPSIDNDGDVDMGLSDPQPAPRTPTPPPPPPPVAPTASFSIRSLLNPAPDKPRSKLHVDIPPPVAPSSGAVTVSQPEPAKNTTTTTEPQPAPTTVPPSTSLPPPPFRTSSPTLNFLLAGPKPAEQQSKPSPLGAAPTVVETVRPVSEPPSPEVVPQEPSLPEPPIAEEREPSVPTWSFEQKVEEVEASLDKPDEPMAAAERQSMEIREPSPLPQVPDLDMPDAGAEIPEAGEDSVMVPAEDASVGIQSPLPPVPEPEEEVVLKIEPADVVTARPSIDLDPPSSSPLSEAPPELPVISMSFADYARQKRAKAKEQQKEKAKESEKEIPGDSGSGALDIVLESKEPSRPDNAAEDVSSTKESAQVAQDDAFSTSVAPPQPQPQPEMKEDIEPRPDRRTATPSPSDVRVSPQSSPLASSGRQPSQNLDQANEASIRRSPSSPHSPAQAPPTEAVSNQAPSVASPPRAPSVDKSMDIDTLPAADTSSPAEQAERPVKLEQPVEALAPSGSTIEAEDNSQPEVPSTLAGSEDPPAPVVNQMSPGRSSSPPESELVTTPTVDHPAPNGIITSPRDLIPKVNGINLVGSPSPSPSHGMSTRREPEPTPSRVRHRPLVVSSPTSSREPSPQPEEAPSTPRPAPMTPPRAPGSVTAIDAEEVDKEEGDDDDAHSQDGSRSVQSSDQSPVNSEKKSGKPKIPEVPPPLQLNTDFGALAAKLVMVVAEDDKEKDRYHAPTPPPQPAKKPPTGPRRGTTAGPPPPPPPPPPAPVATPVSANAAPAEEGEIPSSPGHAPTPLALRI
ncbi:hypothetical protein FRC00_004022, partial [Tulasnella sp. 408]